MKVFIGLFCCLSLIFMCASSDYAAKTFHKDGYTLKLSWGQEGKKVLKVAGKIKDGPGECPQLNIHLSFNNNVDSDIAYIDSTIRNYHYKHWNKFYGRDELIWAKSGSSRHWFLDSISINCLQ